MVDVTVFEQAPQLQASQLNEAMQGLTTAKSAVESIDRPQLSAQLHHRKHRLLEMSRCIS